MKSQRLYKAELVSYPGDALIWTPEDECEEWEAGFEVETCEIDGATYYGFLNPDWEPDGWREYAEANDIRDRDNGGPAHFFWPNTDGIFRSRSSAQSRVDIINRWGGKAVLMECTPEWTTVEQANARRKLDRLNERVKAAEDQLSAVVDQRDSAAREASRLS